MGRSPWCATDSVLNRGPWTAQEDLILRNYISIHGEGRWKALPKNAGLNRCGKSCRLRWLNYLRPNIKRGNISPDEEELIIRMHKLLGNRWSLIAGRLPGRTDNEIKNYWNTHLSKTRVPEMEMIQQPHTPHTKSKRAHIEGRIAKRRKLYVGSGDSDHQELKSSDVEEAVKASKCWCDIVDPAITENICESMEINYELNVNDGPFQHSQHYSDKEVGTSHVLKEILSYWECDILFSPCDNFRFKEVVARSSDELDQVCFLESTVDDDRGMAEIYSDTQQPQVDWVNELVCLDMWEERSSNIFSQKMSI